MTFDKNLYSVQVKSGQEHKAIQHMGKINKLYEYTKHMKCFAPTYEKFFKRSGEIYTQLHILFPGYVFIETNLNETEFYEYIKMIKSKYNGFINLLYCGDKASSKISTEDLTMLRSLCNDDWCIKASKGFKDGKRITIIEGALVGKEANIVKIISHAMKAFVEIELFGLSFTIEVGLEILNKNIVTL